MKDLSVSAALRLTAILIFFYHAFSALHGIVRTVLASLPSSDSHTASAQTTQGGFDGDFLVRQGATLMALHGIWLLGAMWLYSRSDGLALKVKRRNGEFLDQVESMRDAQAYKDKR